MNKNTSIWACTFALTISLGCSFDQKSEAMIVHAKPPLLYPEHCTNKEYLNAIEHAKILAILRSEKKISQFKLLKDTRYFADGPVGVGGEIPEELAAHHSLFNSRHARQIYELLYAEAQTEGKLYALAGLFFKDYCSFYSKLLTLKDNSDYVLWWGGGCGGDAVPLSELLYNPKATVKIAGDDPNACRKRSEVYEIEGTDFAGGAVPFAMAPFGYCINRSIKPQRNKTNLFPKSPSKALNE